MCTIDCKPSFEFVLLPWNDQTLQALKLAMTFSGVSARCKDIETQWVKSSFCEPPPLLTRDQMPLHVLKAFLKLSKHETSRGWTTWEVCEDNIIMSNPMWWGCLTTWIVTRKFWPSRISKCRFSSHYIDINCSQNAITTLRKGRHHPHLGLHGHAISCLTFWYVVDSHLFTFENVKFG